MSCDPFSALMAASASTTTSRPVLFVMLMCDSQEDERASLSDLWALYQECLWWGTRPTETREMFDANIKQIFTVKRNTIPNKAINWNRRLGVVAIDAKLMLAPLECIIGLDELVECPPLWHMRPSLSIRVSQIQHQGQTKLFATEEGTLPPQCSFDWNEYTKPEAPAVKRSLPVPDAGYIYMMIDTQERQDQSLWVKLGMTGATQTPMDRLISLRTGNPHLMLGISALVIAPKAVEQRVHQGVLDIADRIEVHGSKEFFKIKPGKSLFDMTERVLKLTFAHRLNARDLVRAALL